MPHGSALGSGRYRLTAEAKSLRDGRKYPGHSRESMRLGGEHLWRAIKDSDNAPGQRCVGAFPTRGTRVAIHREAETHAEGRG